MNNDKRIILAIAVYAAVMTMILHTITSEGRQRFNAAEAQSIQYYRAIEASLQCADIDADPNKISCSDETTCERDEVNFTTKEVLISEGNDAQG